jgi:hypothetical protein
MDAVELDRKLQERLWQMPPADWVLDMIDHYRATGSYRPEDLHRLLGDPRVGVTGGSTESLASCLLKPDA